jgi:hypothetical protein
MFTQKDYKNFVVDIGKYHYLIVNSNKSIILSSSNSKSEARQEALNKLQPIMNAVLGKNIYLLTIRVIPKEDIKGQEQDTIKVFGGPIEVSIEKIQVVSQTKLKNLGGFRNKRAFFTDEYFKKYKEIKKNSLEQFAHDYHINRYDLGPFDLYIIELMKPQYSK